VLPQVASVTMFISAQQNTISSKANHTCVINLETLHVIQLSQFQVRLKGMKFISFIILYARFWWLTTIKIQSTHDEEKKAAYYKQADALEQKIYQLIM
jgi:hypothetical protein